MILNPNNNVKTKHKLSTVNCQLSIGFILILLFLFFFNQTYSQAWHTYFGDRLSPDALPGVKDIYVDDSSFYITGNFRYAGDLPVYHVAKWHNYQWYNLGLTYSWNATDCLVKYNDNLYVGGAGSWKPNDIDHMSGLAYWDGEEWNNVCQGSGVTAGREFFDLIVFNDTLFAAGKFYHVCGVDGYAVKAFDGTEWIYLGSPSINAGMTFGMYNNELLLGTRFTGLYKRKGTSTWESFPGGPDGVVNKMIVDTFNNFLYVGGGFYYVADTLLSVCVAMWDGFQWHSLDNGVGGEVYLKAMEIYRGDLYIGGNFMYTSNLLPVNFIARWDGEQWHNLSEGCGQPVFVLKVFQDTLLVGGYFSQVGDSLPAYGLAKWYMPESCNYIKPIIHTYQQEKIPQDTFYLTNGQAEINFYNNNAYADLWEWEFGDGNKAYEKEPVHIYNYPGTYNINITVSHNGCTRTTEKTIKVLLPVETEIFAADKINFKLYPNPANDDVIIECTVPADVKIPEIKAYTSTGTLLKTTKLKSGYNKFSLPASQWSKGTVIIALYFENKQILSEKLIVN